MGTRTVGTRVKRNEDGRLIRGQGRYVDDIPLENALHGAFLRSDVARARISNLDVSRAAALPGVRKIYTFADLGELGVTMPLLIPHPCITHGRTQYALAKDDVFHVGQAIAFVVAEDRYIAEDAVALVDVDYERLPVEMDLEKAMEPGAPLVHETFPTTSPRTWSRTPATSTTPSRAPTTSRRPPSRWSAARPRRWSASPSRHAGTRSPAS